MMQIESDCHSCNTDSMIAPMPTDYDTLLTVAEAAARLRLAASTVASMVSRGTLATVNTRFGKLITVESVDQYAIDRRGKFGHRKQS